MLDSDVRERFRKASFNFQDWKQQIRDEILCHVYEKLLNALDEDYDEPGACAEEPPNCGAE